MFANTSTETVHSVVAWWFTRGGAPILIIYLEAKAWLAIKNGISISFYRYDSRHPPHSDSTVRKNTPRHSFVCAVACRVPTGTAFWYLFYQSLTSVSLHLFCNSNLQRQLLSPVERVTQNQRILEFEMISKDPPVQFPCRSRITWSTSHRKASRWILDVSSEGGLLPLIILDLMDLR